MYNRNLIYKKKNIKNKLHNIFSYFYIEKVLERDLRESGEIPELYPQL